MATFIKYKLVTCAKTNIEFKQLRSRLNILLEALRQLQINVGIENTLSDKKFHDYTFVCLFLLCSDNWLILLNFPTLYIIFVKFQKQKTSLTRLYIT